MLLSSADPAQLFDHTLQILQNYISSDSNKESTTSLAYDVVQAQLALWTFFLVPTVFISCCVISCLLTTLVVLGRLFSAPVPYKDFLAIDQSNEIEEPDYGRRQRSYSGTSSVSLDSGDPLPKPLCRRHSSSHTSLCSRPPSVNRKLSYCYSHYNSTDD
ncbi:hypothetical protein WR25_03747 [Diploscapter pachys]|uniref:Uncharacterized protein n=1 Tax=Diploscapter pachys TaxID=2018661 RepID=A0A2A2LNH6_9BILA|nr:hypothetical protein WR25_03747 [Diploscapter pachys]